MRGIPVVVIIAYAIIILVRIFLLAIVLCYGVPRRGRNFFEGVFVGVLNDRRCFDNLMKSVRILRVHFPENVRVANVDLYLIVVTSAIFENVFFPVAIFGNVDVFFMV